LTLIVMTPATATAIASLYAVFLLRWAAGFPQPAHASAALMYGRTRR
jgi:hypothetical protein